MKNFSLLILSFCLLTLVGKAQTFSVEPNQTLYLNNVPMDELSTHYIYQFNIMNDDIQMAWERVYVDVPVGWENYLCDIGACYVNIPEGATVNGLVAPGSNGFIGLNLVPNSEGMGEVQINVWDVAFPEYKVLCTFYFSSGVVSVLDVNETEVLMYPNPASDVLNLKFQSIEQLKFTNFTMLDFTGRVVINENIRTGSHVSFNVSELSAGIYVALFRNINGISIEKKIVIQ